MDEVTVAGSWLRLMLWLLLCLSLPLTVPDLAVHCYVCRDIAAAVSVACQTLVFSSALSTLSTKIHILDYLWLMCAQTVLVNVSQFISCDILTKLQNQFRLWPDLHLQIHPYSAQARFGKKQIWYSPTTNPDFCEIRLASQQLLLGISFLSTFQQKLWTKQSWETEHSEFRWWPYYIWKQCFTAWHWWSLSIEQPTCSKWHHKDS